jgi:Tfp pilus assembly protein PilO
MMTKRTTKRVPLLGALAALLLAVAFWFLLYSPRNADLELVREEVTQLETQRSSLQGEVARLRDVEVNQVQYRSKLARLEELIPSGTAQSTAVRQFQLVADAAGIEIDAVSFASPVLVPDAPSTGVPETALARIPVTMSLSGGYFQVVDFFRRLEVETPRALLIGNLSATEDEEDKFPALGSTWTGDLFAVVPIASIPPEVPVEPPAEGEPAEDAPAEDAPVEAAAEEGATS